jgi:hypothetical protein
MRFRRPFVATEPDCDLVVIVSDGEIVETREFTSPPAATVAALRAEAGLHLVR